MRKAAIAILFGLRIQAQVQERTPAQTFQIPLQVETGVPLRLYLTKPLSMHIGDIAAARFAQPVYVFDRVVIPAGSEVQGRVTALDPVGKPVRAMAMLRGDFTPLHFGRVEFTSLQLPTGSMDLRTLSSVGLPTIYREAKPPKKSPKKTTAPANPSSRTRQLHDLANREINAEINAQLDSRTYGLGSLVRGPNKMERLEDLLYSKLPYHPQKYRRGTRFDAVLEQPLDFAGAAVPADSLSQLGTEASNDRAVEVRFLSAVSSSRAKVGDPVEAVLSEPLFSSASKLILPEGTHLTGTVRQARPARWFHRGGKLRFTFDKLSLPSSVAQLPPRAPASPAARLMGAETNPSASVKIDSEGSAQATTSKIQLLRPLIASLIALKSLDNDTGKATSAEGSGSTTAAHGLGGLSGFGLLGFAASRASATAGSALGVWGMAASVYLNVVSRGPEVQFDKNASMVVRFGARSASGPPRK
jgi:hypothetical protein